MIFGIGHDIVSNARITTLLDKYGTKLVNKVLTEEEKVIFNNHSHQDLYLAKRFAAKEAFAKACGTGIRAPILFTNITILNNQLGKPYFSLSDSINEWLAERQIINTHLSISDEHDFSSAFVILEKS